MFFFFIIIQFVALILSELALPTNPPRLFTLVFPYLYLQGTCFPTIMYQWNFGLTLHSCLLTTTRQLPEQCNFLRNTPKDILSVSFCCICLQNFICLTYVLYIPCCVMYDQKLLFCVILRILPVCLPFLFTVVSISLEPQ